MTRDAFKREFLKYQPGFVKLAHDYVHDWEKAQDAVMDTAEHLCTRLAAYDPERATFRTWFSAAVKRQCLMCLRSERREAAAVDRSRKLGSGHWITRTADTTLVESGGMVLDVKNALAKFSPDERALLEEVLGDGVEVDTRLTSAFGQVVQRAATRRGVTARSLLVQVLPLVARLREALAPYDNTHALPGSGSTQSV